MEKFSASVFDPFFKPRHRFMYLAGLFGFAGLFCIILVLIAEAPLSYAIPGLVSVAGSAMAWYLLETPKRESRKHLAEAGYDSNEMLAAYKVFTRTLQPVPLANNKVFSLCIESGQLVAYVTRHDAPPVPLQIGNENFRDGNLSFNHESSIPARYIYAMFRMMPKNTTAEIAKLRNFILHDPETGFTGLAHREDNGTVHVEAYRTGENSGHIFPRNQYSTGGTIFAMSPEHFRWLDRKRAVSRAWLGFGVMCLGPLAYIILNGAYMDGFFGPHVITVAGFGATIPLTVKFFQSPYRDVFTPEEENIFSQKIKDGELVFECARWSVVVLNGPEGQQVVYAADPDAFKPFDPSL